MSEFETQIDNQGAFNDNQYRDLLGTLRTLDSEESVIRVAGQSSTPEGLRALNDRLKELRDS